MSLERIRGMEEPEIQLKKELEKQMEKSIQLKNFNKVDLKKGGKYHKSYLKFLAEFKETFCDFLFFLITENIYLKNDDIFRNFVNEYKEDINITFRYALDGNMELVEKFTEKLKNRLIDKIFS